MAFQLNLYHELHKEAQARARDPLKLATLAGIGIGGFMVLYYGFQYLSVSNREGRARDLQEQWRQKEPELKKAVDMEVELLAAQKTNKALMERVQGRFYWAPFFDRFIEVVPPEVQIQGMECSEEGKGAKVVTLRGLAAGVEPRSVAENFRLSLQAKLGERYDAVSVSYTGNDSLVETQETVELNGETLAVARFGLKISFAPKPKVAEETAPPTAPLAKQEGAAR